MERKLYSYMRLAKVFVNRSLGTKENSVIPVATVARNLITEHPELLKLILATLHQVSALYNSQNEILNQVNPLIVPMYWSYDQNSLEARMKYEKKMGYLQETGPSAGPVIAEDNYLERQSGVVMFHAALIAVQPICRAKNMVACL